MTDHPLSNAADSTERFNTAAVEILMRLGDGALLTRMIDLFIKNAQERIDAARAGVANDDRRAIELAAHSLKSSSAQLGGAALQRASLAVEKSAQTGEPAALLEGIDTMQSEFELLKQWLQQEREKVAARAPAGPPEDA